MQKEPARAVAPLSLGRRTARFGSPSSRSATNSISLLRSTVWSLDHPQALGDIIATEKKSSPADEWAMNPSGEAAERRTDRLLSLALRPGPGRRTSPPTATPLSTRAMDRRSPIDPGAPLGGGSAGKLGERHLDDGAQDREGVSR